MRKKILWISQLIIAVVLLIYAMFSTQIFYENSIATQVNVLKAKTELFYEDDYSLDEIGAKAFSKRLDGVRVSIISVSGEVLGDSEKSGLNNHGKREEVKEAFKNGEGSALRHSATIGVETLYYCRKITLNNQEILLRVSTAAPSVWDSFGDVLPTLVWFLALDFFVCLLFTFLGTGYILQPVQKIAKDAALNLKVDTKYPELKPVVDILNKRNEEVSQKIRELSEEKELVEKAQRSKNDFIANITHEMNTPLTSIRGYSELLASGALDKEHTEQAARILLQQSDRLSKLIACIINYNELDNDTLPSYEVDASKLAKEILETLAPNILKRNIRLVEEIEEGITVKSRHERVNEVFGNLIRNAIRYNKESGELKISLKRTEKGAKFIVADTGIGIAEENLERVFDRFFTVDKSHNGVHGGFGLGLATVKKICKRSGWVIGVESTLGQGTTFTVDLKI